MTNKQSHRALTCERCEGQGWYFRVPDGFNPFLAGGFTTARTMYRVECNCEYRARAALSAAIQEVETVDNGGNSDG